MSKKKDLNTRKCEEFDLICVGGGIMSATLALLAKILKPELKVCILERLGDVAQESSSAWNNAGTGHSALCELNYTPQNEDGSVNINKAIDICTQFEISKQFWSYLVAQGLIENPETFITGVPHHSWVAGEDNAKYLEERFKTMKEHFMFDSIDFTRDIEKMKEWFPIMMADRSTAEIMAASRIDRGAEMNFGSLTKHLYHILETKYDTKVVCYKEVLDADCDPELDWTLKVKDVKTHVIENYDAEHVFIGAGGASLLLLQKIDIKAKEGYGGFPISGQWLVCKNRDIVEQHNAKVYSKAGIGDPPMSVPHLDTRFIDGKRELLFGPFAGFSPKFLKKGSPLDLIHSLKFKNLQSMWGVFWHNLPLTEYLIKQISMSFEDRMNALRAFVKDAKNEDWEIMVAGQRVQTIKKDTFEGGVLEFGTEIVSSSNGKVTCLLGASPGASTSVKIMLDVLNHAFPDLVNCEENQPLLNELVPFYHNDVDEAFFNKHLKRASETLGIGYK